MSCMATMRKLRLGGPRRRAQAVHQAFRGSWPYGEGASLSWSDSFHSGYVLTCLERLRHVTPWVDDAEARGAAYYRGFLRR
jgi:hypothetical protein